MYLPSYRFNMLEVTKVRMAARDILIVVMGQFKSISTASPGGYGPNRGFPKGTVPSESLLLP